MNDPARRSSVPTRWTVVDDSSVRRGRVRVRCLCGTEREISLRTFRSGDSKSCGCLRKDINRTHGGASRYGLYALWAGLISRCHGKARSFSEYGGRGIEVCDRWRFDFAAFRDDMGPWLPGTSIDRIDNNGDYEPGNCRWATRAEQSRNKRNNVWLTLKGETLCVTDWAVRLNVTKSAIRNRMLAGWSDEKAVTTPFRDFKGRRT